MSQTPPASVSGTSSANATRSLDDCAIAPPASGITTVDVAQAALTRPIAAPAPTSSGAARRERIGDRRHRRR
jgi:hypothetical protein